MSVAEQVTTLLEWCATNSVFIDSQIRIGPDEQGGIGVYSKDLFIPPHRTLVKICKDAVLSVRSCSLADCIPFAPYGLGAQLSLSLALYVELLKQEKSRWHGYLQSLPNRIVDLPLFWDLNTKESDCEDGSEALTWLRGTEAARILQAPTENDSTTLDEINRFYNDFAEPLLLRNSSIWQCSPHAKAPTLVGFYRSISLVSSRAFLVDAYHGLSMVPIADAFNHVVENHVHLESDYNVCPECGSLHECPHDRGEDTAGTIRESAVLQPQEGDHDLFYEMVSNAAIPPQSEIFNTYGEELTNAQLLNQYGFILDINDNDRLSWSTEEILQSILPSSKLSEGEVNLLSITARGVLSGLTKDSAFFLQSELVYHEAKGDNYFCLNGEGKVSHALWALLLAVATQWSSRPVLETEMNKVLHASLNLQLHLESLDDGNGSDDDDVNAIRLAQTLDIANATLLNTLMGLGRSVVLLCTARKRNSGKPGSSEHDLFDLMEEMPENRKRTRMALSVLISERSILDCCEAGWNALLNSGKNISCELEEGNFNGDDFPEGFHMRESRIHVPVVRIGVSHIMGVK